jgi:SAM-dependent methyltransferase
VPRCPVCYSADTFEFLRRGSVPVHQNLLLETADAARGLARGDLAMCLCAACGFGFNAAFRPELLDYGRRYDNAQNWSPAFDAYVDGLVRDLVEGGVRDCRVVEVGCGKGTFLTKLVAWPGAGNTGHGFDPTYVGPDEALDGRLRFERCFYGAECANVPADVVVCRHVIEHVPRPLGLLRSVRAALAGSPGARVFFETPCLEWVLRQQVTWDFFYEHCSLFTASSLVAALTRAGFADIAIRHVFHGQYLWLEARAAGAAAPAGGDTREVAALARAFAREDRRRLHGWEELVGLLAARGRVAVWGAGAKGVTFCNLLDPNCRLLHCVIDVNPAKQGQFVAGTGHRIVGPERLRAEGVGAVLVLNPIYTAEVAAQVTWVAPGVAVLDAMHEASVLSGKWLANTHGEPRVLTTGP